MFPSKPLCNQFQQSFVQDDSNPSSQATERPYLRAEAIARTYGAVVRSSILNPLHESSGLTIDDVVQLSPKFWNMHTDPILCFDGAATTLLAIQCNLAAGTLGTFADRGDIATLVNDLLSFRLMLVSISPGFILSCFRLMKFSGQFCLTELDHGLDVVNLETTATRLSDGGFELHTPHPGAAKYWFLFRLQTCAHSLDIRFMPPTIPVLGRACFAVVFARLIVDEVSIGIRPFLVQLNDGFNMCMGISAKYDKYRLIDNS